MQSTSKKQGAKLVLRGTTVLGTTAAPRYHFSTVPVPSALRYYLVPQYHNYRGSSARYCPMLTHSNKHSVRLHCIWTHCTLRLVLYRSLLNCTRFSYLFYVGQMSDGCYGRQRSSSVPISLFRTYIGKLEELKIQLCFYSRFLIILLPNRI